MADALDRDLDEAILELEQMGRRKRIVLGEVHPPDREIQAIKLQKTASQDSDQRSCGLRISEPQNPRTRHPVRYDWDTAEEITVPSVSEHPEATGGNRNLSDSVIRRPGESNRVFGNRISNFFSRFSINADVERIWNIVFFIITLGMLWLIFTNFDRISVLIATFFLKMILAIGEIFIGIVLLVIIWFFIRSRMRRRRWRRW